MGTQVLDPMPVHDFQLRGAGVLTPEVGGERNFIEQLRRITFGIGDGKASKMAEILHRTIKHVSTEIYQKDIHFLAELLQNAEDNEYPVGVTPSLHLVLTYHDICKVGAPATLAIFNNECGFTEGNVEALCNVGYSTKKKTRGKGYIGEKGIGFKSVFLVSSQPYVISNGFRIRLNENKDKQADVGFIVPEWVDDPSDEQLSQLFGVGLKLPTTVILLPLKADKVAAVQQQIAQISPEILLFLAQIKELAIRDDRPGAKPRVVHVCRKFWPVIHQNELSTVELYVNGLQQESASYFCCSQKVPVTLPKDCCIEERSSVENWAITLAFPLEGRISGGTSGDVYSFLPTEHQSGLPCLLNADFILTSSRESIRFDSPWNQGIFEAVPQVFVNAFSIMIDGLMTEFLHLQPQSVYQFVPTKLSSNRYFRRLQESVILALASRDVVLCFPKSASRKPPVYRPSQCHRLSKKFCEILKHAAVRLACQVSDFIGAERFIVDTEVQDKFGAQLDALGVVQFHPNQYVPVLGPWILELQEDVYVKLLHFVASDLGQVASASLCTIPLLKYAEPDGSVGLASLSQAETLGKIKVPAPMSCPWLPWLCGWIQVFFHWMPIYFLPIETVREILQLDAARREAIWCWLRTFAKVTELSVRDYSHELISHTPKDPGYCILVTQYLFSIEERFANDPAHVSLASFLANRLPVVDINNATVFQGNNAWLSRRQVMLPGCSSHWPLLLPGDSWGGHLIKMHDDYMTPQCALVNLSADALARYSRFLRGHFCARDLLEIDPPNCPLPQLQQGGNTTDRAVNLLLDWVQAIIRRGGKGKLTANGEFMASIQSFHWLPTLDHGDKRPTDVFWPSTAALEVFRRPSVPFLKPTYCNGSEHGESLAFVGLVVDVNLGHRAVVSLMNDLFHQQADSLSKDMILNIYEGMRRMQWDCGEIEAIWIPPFPGNNNIAHWVLVKDCVAYDEDGLFQNYFPAVLSETYDEGFLQFFVSKFHVQSEPTVEDYCLYWKLCMNEGKQLSHEDCKKVWGTIVNLHHKCEKKVWEDFVSTVDKVPAIEAGKSEYSFELKQASQVYIPDRLEFADKFGSTPSGLWIPLSQAAPENLQDLYSVYRFLGAKTLSDCTQIRLTEEGKRCLALRKKRTRGWICEGFFRAILGFLHGQGRSQVRHKWLSIVSALVDTSDIEMDSPIEIEYCLYPTKDERNEVVNRASGFRMAYWDKKSECLFSVDHERSSSATERATVQLEFSHAIAEGLLGEYSRDLVEDMRKFLFAYAQCNFQVEVVNQMLRADNIQLSPQQEDFIASRFQRSNQASGVGYDTGLVDTVVATNLDPSIASRCMVSHDIVDFPLSETKVDVWSDAGVFCSMPPLATDSLLGESFLDPVPSKMAFNLNPQAPPFFMKGWQETSSSSGGSKQLSLPAPVTGMMTACGRHHDMPDGGNFGGHGANMSAKGSSEGSSWSASAASSCKHFGSHRKQHDFEFVSVNCTNSWQPLVHLNEGDANDWDAHGRQIKVEGIDTRSDNQAAVDNVRDNGIGTNGQPLHSHLRGQNGSEVGVSDHTKASKPVSSPDSGACADRNIQELRRIDVSEEGDLLGVHPVCGEDTGKLSNGGRLKPGKSCNGSAHLQPRQEPSIPEGHFKAHPKGQSNGKAGKHRNVIRGALTENREMKSEFKSASPSSSSLRPSSGKEDGRCTRSAGSNGSCKQPNSTQSLSPSTGSESSRDYENERLQLFLESVYESSGAHAAGTDGSSECSSVPTESESRFRHGARRLVFTLPAQVVNAGEGDHVNGEQKLSPGHSRLQAAPVKGQKPHQFSPRDETLIKRWCMYRAPQSEGAKMAAAIELPAETYESLDWWRKEHLPEVKKILGYTMARHLSMKLGPREERCDIDSLLTLAFLHQRYPHANGASYQRLEFLGDACLGVGVTTELFRQHPKLNEHFLTQLRSALVCNSTCALFFRSAHLERHVITGVGKVSPEAVTDSIAADVFEAILGAGFLAHGKQGLLEVHRLVFEVFLPHLQASVSISSDPL